MTETHTPTDWEAIERMYRAGQLSVSEIARQHGVSHTAINKRAKKRNWTRDLAAKVREAVSAKLISTLSAASERQAIEEAANTAVAVVREHRVYISQARKIVRQLMDELERANENIVEIEDAIENEPAEALNTRRRARMLSAVSISSRAATILSLSSSLKSLVSMEREAFNLDADIPPESDASNLTDEQLNDRIARLAGKS